MRLEFLAASEQLEQPDEFMQHLYQAVGLLGQSGNLVYSCHQQPCIEAAAALGQICMRNILLQHTCIAMDPDHLGETD